MVGLQGFDAREFAKRSQNLLLTSTRLEDGPHVQLLRQAASNPGLTDAEILSSPYGRLAEACKQICGHFFGVLDDRDVVAIARSFIAWGVSSSEHKVTYGGSAPDAPILVARIKGTHLYQVVDGHHRASVAAYLGQEEVRVRLTWLSVETPLQLELSEMSWLAGERNMVYQPIEAPELAKSWITVRKCSDRLQKMLEFLRSDSSPTIRKNATYVDLACCYGWFVRAMRDEGYDASGLELDPRAKGMAASVYGLPEDAVAVGDVRSWADEAAAAHRQWDVVSCFSLIHHVFMAEGASGAASLVKQLDQVTGQVLFLDSGEEHESWFHESLAGWNASTIQKFLEENTSFSRVVNLGPDDDGVYPYVGKYGRHLFACVR